MKIITRAQAKDLGLTRYFTGKPCIHGHLSEKMTSTATCKKCMDLYVIENKEKIKLKKHLSYKNNKEIVNAKNLVYRQKNREKINKKSKEYYLLNKEEIRKRSKIYYQKDPSKAINRYKEWCLNNREKVRISASKRKAKRRCLLVGSFSIKEIRNLKSMQKSKCINCFSSIEEKYHIDHIMPIKLGGTNNIKNIQLLCPTCNIRKAAKHPNDWALENGRLL